jgi:hypothetical protein
MVSSVAHDLLRLLYESSPALLVVATLTFVAPSSSF